MQWRYDREILGSDLPPAFSRWRALETGDVYEVQSVLDNMAGIEPMVLLKHWALGHDVVAPLLYFWKHFTRM